MPELHKQNQIPPAISGIGRKRYTRAFVRRFITPAVVFSIITIILSAIVFFLSMKSGVPEFSLPTLVDLTSKNVSSIKVIYQLEKGVTISSVLFSPDGRYLAVARLDNILHVWSTKDYHLIYTFQTESLCRNCIAFSPDSRYVAAVREGRPYDVMVWDLETGKSFWESLGTLVDDNEYITSLGFSPNGKLLVGAISNRVLFWKIETTGCELVREIVGHNNLINSLAFNPEGTHLLTTSDDKSAKVWDVETGNLIMTLNGHTDSIDQGIYSPDGAWIVTAGYDRTVRFWDSQSGIMMKELDDHASPIISLAFSPNGQLLASGGLNERVILWDGQNWTPVLTVEETSTDISPLAFSPDNKIIVTTNIGGTLRLWGVKK